MTVLQALRITVGYPLDAGLLERIAIDRSLVLDAVYSGVTDEFMLARADVYAALAASPDTTMDGFSITVADRDLLCALAEDIYRRYDPMGDRVRVSRNQVRDGSQVW